VLWVLGFGVRGALAGAVRRLKDESGDGPATGGAMLPTALAEPGLIDEYKSVVHHRRLRPRTHAPRCPLPTIEPELVDRFTVPGAVASR
jgi:hypothetical protein